jgi:hypothetical protein
MLCRTLHRFGTAVAIVLMAAAPALAQVQIDKFLDPFPPNPDLPVGGAEVLFVGTWCDGGVCPPGLIVTHATQDACSQTGLPNVLGGERNTLLLRSGTTGNGDAGAYGGYLCQNHSSFGRSKLFVDYGVTVDLNANLTIGLATALRIDVVGDMYSGPRPVPFTITVTSRRGTPQQATASATQNLVLEGTYTYPFAGFAGVDFTDVDAISIVSDATNYSAVDLCIYNFQTNGIPVGVESIDVGRFKVLYR